MGREADPADYSENIFYSAKFSDTQYEYRHVTLPQVRHSAEVFLEFFDFSLWIEPKNSFTYLHYPAIGQVDSEDASPDGDWMA